MPTVLRCFGASVLRCFGASVLRCFGASVLRFEGLRVVIYPNDHRPAHVHVIGRGCEALFFLGCPDGPPELRENFRFAASEVSAIIEALAGHVRRLCRRWEEIHGQP